MNTISDPASRRVNIIQGEWIVLDDPNAVITTILGSCVAACLRDPAAGIGGMNHFVLAGDQRSPAQGADATRYGVHLMELLINGLLKTGAKRERLEAKIFGGAQTLALRSSVGEQNAAFASRFLKDEGIRIVGASTGGDFGRKLEYWPVSGRARQHPLSGIELHTMTALEQRPIIPPMLAENDVDFF